MLQLGGAVRGAGRALDMPEQSISPHLGHVMIKDVACFPFFFFFFAFM